MTRQSHTRNGLDVDVPTGGIAADAYNVACTALYLARCGRDGTTQEPARHAVTLHRLSGQLHRLAERQCNEDLHCKTCDGTGLRSTHNGLQDCIACVGFGVTTGRRLERLQRQCREIAEHYGLECYFQGDPRGCALYLIDPGIIPAVERLGQYVYQCDGPNPDPTTLDMRKRLRERWIAANYNRGHAVTRLGR